MSAPLPDNEAERLELLIHYQILDTFPEPAFDHQTQLAAMICDTPISLISLVDAKRQWFKSRVGIDATETPRDLAFCAYALLQPDLLIVPDATADPRFANNPLVVGAPNIRFYAGAPITAPSGHILGTLCVIDRKPRVLNGQQCEALKIIAQQVMTHLELRWQLQERTRAEQSLLQAHQELEQRVGERTKDLAEAQSVLHFLNRNLQDSNAELAHAYDSTIEGWSRALDLRDKETEGHCQRVTEMTLFLARVLGLSDEECIAARWGSLLHDIGKMGIPDSILLKPGPLTPEERRIIERHPVYAYELLSPISFLRPALDIPYYHHEKWDGTGYPCGLRGKAIPLMARLFAVVDVWDALRSDRPYRQAWSEEKVCRHLGSLSGTHFDPEMVALFLRHIPFVVRDQQRVLKAS